MCLINIKSAKKLALAVVLTAFTMHAQAQHQKSVTKSTTRVSVQKVNTGTYDAGITAIDPGNRLSMWPKYQTGAINFDGKMKNMGDSLLDSVVVNVEVKDDNAILVYSGSQTVYNIDTAVSVPFSISSYTATALGLYTIKAYTTIPTTGDNDASNDTMYSYFAVTDSVYARDYASFTGITNTETFHSTDTSLTVIGQSFTLTNPDELTAIYFTLVNPKSIGDSLYAVVYSTLPNGYPDTLIGSTVVHILDSTDVNSTTNYSLAITNGPLQLPAGRFYIGIREFDQINLGGTNRVFTPFTTFSTSTAINLAWKRNEEYSDFYSFVLRPVFGCTLQSTATSTNETCNAANATAQIAVTGNSGTINYLWSTGNTTDSISNLSAGSYLVTVSDAAGCSQITNLIIAAVPVPVIDSSFYTNINCHGLSTGSAMVYANSGLPPFSYQWTGSTVSTTSAATNLTAGAYSVLITDQNGCTIAQQFTLTQPDTLIGLVSVSPDNGTSNGIAFIAMTGGTPPYAYFWSNGSSMASATGLTAATYIVIVTDAHSCSYSTTVQVPTSSGISQLNAGITNFEINPNPSNGYFNLALSLTKSSNVTVTLYDLTGAKIYNQAFENVSDLNQSFNFNNLTKGIYMMQLQTDKGLVHKRILIE